MTRSAALALVAAVWTSGCAGRTYTASPVVAAPTSPEEEEALRAALAEGGPWRVDRTVHSDGSEVSESAAHVQLFDFQPDGTLDWRFNAQTGKYRWSVEGKNLTTTHPGFQAMRVDAIDPGEMRAYWYAISSTLVFRR